jgi:hypothetical protein
MFFDRTYTTLNFKLSHAACDEIVALKRRLEVEQAAGTVFTRCCLNSSLNDELARVINCLVPSFGRGNTQADSVEDKSDSESTDFDSEDLPVASSSGTATQLDAVCFEVYLKRSAVSTIKHQCELVLHGASQFRPGEAPSCFYFDKDIQAFVDFVSNVVDEISMAVANAPRHGDCSSDKLNKCSQSEPNPEPEGFGNDWHVLQSYQRRTMALQHNYSTKKEKPIRSPVSRFHNAHLISENNAIPTVSNVKHSNIQRSGVRLQPAWPDPAMPPRDYMRALFNPLRSLYLPGQFAVSVAKSVTVARTPSADAMCGCGV